ncbi:disease resistance protein RGA2-like isoform X2 [Phragmites australis]|nr:disease resistance protein RGA2-like isoform X2 [Phragmites australis]
MAVVLDAFASYVARLLTDMTREEVGILLGVSSEINSLSVKLGDLENILDDADRRNITDRSVQGWVRELKDAMYEAIDILDLCQLRAMERGPLAASTAGCCNPLLFCLRNPLFAHDIGSRIRALNRRLDGIKERSAQLRFLNLSSNKPRNSKVTSRRAAIRETTGEPVRSDVVVGEKIKEDTRELVEMLTEKEGSNSDIMVVAIVGVGGIGKTTLAREIFNHETIKDKFDKRIWLSINQDFDKAELLRTAITLAGGDHSGEKAMAVLMPALAAALAGKKLLLVMDDVWSHKAWEDVLETPLVNAALREGSRVMVTTRDVRVARAMKAVQPYHHVDKLGPEDAWLLLKKQVVSNEINEANIDMLKDIGMEIIAKCDGLPLAVKVMGGLLCQKERNRSDWEKVLNDSAWSVAGMPEELNYAVYLSYEDLSPCLKQCFLHYSLLPKNIVFGYDIIVGMWISEGFVHGSSLDELEESGRQYYKELIVRNLIEPDKEYIDQYHCTMHDVVRSFGQCVSGDEALVAHNGEIGIISKLNSEKFLRLCIETRGSESGELQWSMLQGQRSLRTLISIGQFNIMPGDSLIAFSSLRTLHIQSANVAPLLDTLYQLKHLRYLSIRYCDISRLPENIGKMKFLQLISLRGCERLTKLPNSIVKLGQLRYLSLTGTSINVGIPRGFGGLTNLRKLYGFPALMCGDWCSLEELGPLFQLRDLAIKGLENVSAASLATKAKLGAKEHLTYLTLGCSSRLGDDGLATKEGNASEEEQGRIVEVFDELCPPPCLESLDIGGYFGQRLPRWMMSSTAMVALKFLRFLTMDDLAFCTKLPDGLCQLPCLQLLQVDHAPAIRRVGPDFQRPYHGHPPQAEAAFPRLHRLEFIGMVEWEEWEWEERTDVQALPVLEVLLLKRCKLRRVPPGLASHARALKKVYIYEVQHLSSLESLASIIELDVFNNPNLEKITNLPKLRSLTIVKCPKMKVLHGVPTIQRLGLEDYCMETLPTYLQNVNPRHLLLDCSLPLLTSIATGKWDKLCHIQRVNAYARDGRNPRKWYVMYTGEPKNIETNIVDRSSKLGGDEEEQQVGTRTPSQAKKKVCRRRGDGLNNTH